MNDIGFGVGNKDIINFTEPKLSVRYDLFAKMLHFN